MLTVVGRRLAIGEAFVDTDEDNATEFVEKLLEVRRAAARPRVGPQWPGAACTCAGEPASACSWDSGLGQCPFCVTAHA